MKKKLPKLTTDEAAETFVAEADLTEYDLSSLKQVRFEFQRLSEQPQEERPNPKVGAQGQRPNTRSVTR